MRTRTAIPTLFLLALAGAAPAWSASPVPHSRGHWGEEHALRVYLGEFEPDGDSAYWNDKLIDFSGDVEDFTDVAGGIEYMRFLSGRMAFVAGTSFFVGETDQFYLDFVDEEGFDIFHTTELETANFTVGVLFHLARCDRAIVPYVGVGGGLWAWRLIERGDFIDFGGPEPEIFFDVFEDEGETFGWYYQAGLEVPLGRNLSFFADAKWSDVEADLEGGFAGLGDIDLSGRTLAGGLTWSF